MENSNIQQIIEEKIFLIREQKVMLASDLAVLYGVPTYRLNEQVKRNIKRFPSDFMFQLTREESLSLRSQIAILNIDNDSLRSQNVTLNIDNDSLRSQNVTLNESKDLLRSQNAISKEGRGGRRYLPYAFTEQGVAMLSSVLNSDKAVEVNIEIMRTFIRLRRILSEHKDLIKKVEEMDKHYGRQFRIIFEIIRELTQPPEKPKKQIGFSEHD